MTVPGDGKDWTWVLERPCPECGVAVAGVLVDDVAGRLRAATQAWVEVMARPSVRERPRPDVWSPLEYGCHVRDVHRVMDARLQLMLTEPDPLFANWDQDETAVAERYGEQDPAKVARDLHGAGEQFADRLAGVRGEQWQRPGRRSNGSVFTVATFARYALHDVEHHLWDVAAPPPLG